MNLEQHLLNSIDNLNKKTTALSFDPQNWYKEFQHHCAIVEMQSYTGVIR